MLLVSIVDSNAKDTEHLCGLLDTYFHRSGTAYSVQKFTSGLDFIRSSENSDIVLMDLQLDRLDGLETARILRKLGSDSQLIFVTRRVDQAIVGYEVDALDFIRKPATQNALNVALDKAVKHLEINSGSMLALKLPGGIISISSNDITFVEVFDHNLVYHTVKGDYNVRGRLGDVYNMLDHERFLLCNRSFLVNLRFVSEIRSDHLMVGKVKIPVSKSHRKEIMSRFATLLEA